MTKRETREEEEAITSKLVRFGWMLELKPGISKTKGVSRSWTLMVDCRVVREHEKKTHREKMSQGTK